MLRYPREELIVMPNHINSSASFGKRQEYAVIAELLRRGYDVYQTFVDDKGIDCIVRLNSREPRYIDIQVKARSKDCNPRNAWRFSTFEINNPGPMTILIFTPSSSIPTG